MFVFTVYSREQTAAGIDRLLHNTDSDLEGWLLVYLPQNMYSLTSISAVQGTGCGFM